MAYYNICPDCGSNLDPGEKCTCRQEKEKCIQMMRKQEEKMQNIMKQEKNGQLRMVI